MYIKSVCPTSHLASSVTHLSPFSLFRERARYVWWGGESEGKSDLSTRKHAYMVVQQGLQADDLGAQSPIFKLYGTYTAPPPLLC